jgi:hypothetical protein
MNEVGLADRITEVPSIREQLIRFDMKLHFFNFGMPPNQEFMQWSWLRSAKFIGDCHPCFNGLVGKHIPDPEKVVNKFLDESAVTASKLPVGVEIFF